MTLVRGGVHSGTQITAELRRVRRLQRRGGLGSQGLDPQHGSAHVDTADISGLSTRREMARIDGYSRTTMVARVRGFSVVANVDGGSWGSFSSII